jgi:hypothetical protein
MKLLLTVFSLLVGCATAEKYDHALSLLMGTTESKLIADWGSPQETRQLDNGDTVLTYKEVHEIETGGLTTNPVNNYNTGRISSDFRSPTYSASRSFAMPTTPTRTITMTCITHFTIHNGLIQSFNHEGDDCVMSD